MLNLRVGRVFTFGGRREGATASEGAIPATPVGSPSGGGSGARGGGTPGPFSAGGPGGGTVASGRHYNLTVSMQVRDLLNHNNPGPIIGNVTSPLFGQANQPAGSGTAIFSESANNRRLELQMRLTF